MKLNTLARRASMIGVALGVHVGLYAVAADDLVDFAGQDPDVEQIRTAFAPVTDLQVRGISPGAIAGAGTAIAPTARNPRKVSFDQIIFDLNSDRLTPKAKVYLDRIGDALSAPELSTVTYSVEGHTDATGSLEYNMYLSKRRAEAVKRYLSDNYDIEARRLTAEGKGPNDLLDKDNPRSGVNRRVVFVPHTVAATAQR